MISLERFNMENHRYIYYISWCNGVNCGYEVSGSIGRRFYMMYPLKKVIKMYNREVMEAKSLVRR